MPIYVPVSELILDHISEESLCSATITVGWLRSRLDGFTDVLSQHFNI